MINEKFATSYGNLYIRVLGRSILGEPSQTIPVESLFIETRKRIQSIVNIPEDKIYSVKQIHGNSVVCSSNLVPQKEEEADGLYSLKQGHLLYIKTADCLPLFFWSQKYPVYGVIHSGWRGAHSKIVENYFRIMAEKRPEIHDWKIYLGPSISMKNYVIQGDVAKYFQNRKKSLHKFEGGYRLGVKEYIVEGLGEFLTSSEFFDSKICTYENTEYFSHRRKDVGRNLNLIWSTL